MAFTPSRSHRPNSLIKLLILFCFVAIFGGSRISPSFAASQAPVAGNPLSYADIADLVTGSPIIISGRITSVIKVKTGAGESGENPKEHIFVTAKVESLIRGQNGVPPLVSFLINPANMNNRLKKRERVLLFALPAQRADYIRLASRNAAQPWSAELDTAVRSVTAEVLKSDSPPTITGIGDAFHIAGTIAGEGETQIFLKTATDAPISLSILRRPGQPPRWGVSLGEIVDESAVPPEHDSLLWYRLACGLPPRLPYESVRTLSLADAEAAQRDYAIVMESLGRCGRTL